MRAKARRSRDRLAHAPDVGRLQVSQAAVDGLEMVERCRGAEVGGAHQRNRQSALRGVIGDCQPVDATAYHEHVEVALGKPWKISNHARISYSRRPCPYVRITLGLSAPYGRTGTSTFTTSKLHASAGLRRLLHRSRQYHFEKLHHLPRLVRSRSTRARRARGGMRSRHRSRSIRARRGHSHRHRPRAVLDRAGRETSRRRGDPRTSSSPTARRCRFASDSFDIVFAHGVVQYTDGRPHARARVPSRPSSRRHGGVSGVEPSLVAQRPVEGDQGRSRARGCADAEDVFDRRVSRPAEGFFAGPDCARRFPVKTRLHGGLKGTLYNTFFVLHVQRDARGRSPAASGGICWRFARCSRCRQA